MGDLEVAGRLFDSFSESNGGSREPSAHGGREFKCPTPDRLLEGVAQRLKSMPGSGSGDSPLQHVQQSARRTPASGAPQSGPGSSLEVARRGAEADHLVSSPHDLPLRHSPGTVPDAGEGAVMASGGGSSNVPATQAHFRHEPQAAASPCLAGDTDAAPQQLLHPSGAAAAASQAAAVPPSLLYRDGSGGSGGGLGQGSHGEGNSSVSSLSSLGQGAHTQSIAAHRGHLHPAMRRPQAACDAAHVLEVASASSVGTPSSRQVGRAPDSGVIPRSVFFDFALGNGAAPGPRWGHTATAVGDRLWVYGGMGTRVFSDLHVYSPGGSTWRSATGTAPNKKDIPGEMFGHAACAAGSRLLVVGGRQGRKFSRSLYILDTGTLEWQRQKEPPGGPPAVANHTFTAVGQHGAYCFGGQGKRTFNSVHKLDPVTLAWEEVKTLGTAPEPRHGHSTIWDESDSLIVFGGAHGTHCLADVHVLSLSTGFWSRPTCSGTAPNPRSNHSAALISPTLMLVFGGCSAAGAFMNDVHILDIATFTWHQPGVVGPAPAARYGHACQVLDGRVIILGGSNAAKAFDGVLTVCTDFGSELNTVADELAGMMAARQQQQQLHGAAKPPAPVSSTSPSAGQPPGPSGSLNAGVRAQLGALLQRRHAQEQQASAARKADVVEGLFNEERRRAEALQAEVAHLQLMQQEAATAHMEQVAGLQQQVELEGRQRWEEAEARALAQQRLKATQEELQQALDASSRNACFRDRCQVLERDLEQRRGTQQRVEAALRLAETNSNALRNQLDISDSTAATLREDLRRLTPPAMRDTAVQVVLAHDPILTPDSPHESPPLPQLSFQQMLQSMTSQQSLAGRSLSGLQLLDLSLGRASSEVRSALASRMAAELHSRDEALKAAQHVVEELQHGCALCMEHPKQVALNCGHQTCQLCSVPLEECPFCRLPVTVKLVLFQN